MQNTRILDSMLRWKIENFNFPEFVQSFINVICWFAEGERVEDGGENSSLVSKKVALVSLFDKERTRDILKTTPQSTRTAEAHPIQLI